MHVVEDLLKIWWFLHISPVRLKAPYNGWKWLKNAASRHSKYIFRTEDEITPLQIFSVENICGVAWSEMYVASTPHPSFQIVVGGRGEVKILEKFCWRRSKKKKKGEVVLWGGVNSSKMGVREFSRKMENCIITV